MATEQCRKYQFNVYVHLHTCDEVIIISPPLSTDGGMVGSCTRMLSAQET